MKTTTIIRVLAAFVLALCAFVFSSTPAFAGAGWDYKASHGLSLCEFEVEQNGTAAVNGSVVNTAPKAVTISAEAGKTLDLKLYCARAQSFDRDGQLVNLGPEVNYSGPGGAGLVVGVDRPEDSVANGYRRPKGRQWTFLVGTLPAIFALTGGADTLTVTIQPVGAPVSQQELQPVAARANEAFEAATHSDYQNRVFGVTGSYLVHLDSIGKSQDARGQRPSASQGLGLDLNVFLGGRSQVKFLTGLTADYMFRQKAVAYAPNLPDNGFNGWVSWSTFYIGPKAGFDYMPVEWFSLQLWGSFGALVSVDGTIPISQLPDRTLYSGESETKGALGYKFGLNPNFVIAQHFVLGLGLGVQGNATQLPLERGPERVCGAKNGSCLEQRQDHFVNALGQLTIGGIF